jgi:drug/metabolite transporter (DMT)-like permease
MYSGPQLSVPDFGWLSLLAIVGIYVNQLFFVVGASMVEAIVASILQPAIPVWTTLIATVLRMEKLTWMKACSILFAVGGAATIAISANLNKKSDKTTSIWGIILLLGNTVASAIYILLMKPILKRGLKPLTITGVAYMVASFVMGATMLVFGAVRPEANIYNFDIVTLWYVLHNLTCVSYLQSLF